MAEEKTAPAVAARRPGIDPAVRDKNLSIALGQIEKEFGKGSIMKLGDNRVADIPVISTGALSLDLALGIMGVPRGRIIEVFGPESSGKTTLCMHIIANAQRAGGVAAIIDAEHAVDPTYARKIGVNIEELLISQPDCGEDALNIADMLIRSNSVDVLVVDSVAALVPRAELEGDIGDSFVGLQARMMSQALRKLTGAISRSRTCCIFTNQIREKIGIAYGNPETTTGGNALKFYSSIRMEIRRTASIKDANNQVQAARTRVKVIKNKLAPPFRTAEFDINWNEGISRSGSIVDAGIEHGIIEKRGSWLAFEGEQLAQGAEKVKVLLNENKELADRIVKKILEKASAKQQNATASSAAPEAVSTPAAPAAPAE